MSVEAKIGQTVSPGTEREMSGFYTRYYVSEKEDSPNKSRVSLRKRLRNVCNSFAPNALVLDVGAGRQVFEREYAQAYGKQGLRMVSVDIASVSHKNMLANAAAAHIRASGGTLPFNASVFDAAVSSMALDFMPPEAVLETQRVLKPGGKVLLNLHHPSLIPEKLDNIARRNRLSQRTREILDFFKYLRDNNILLADIPAIYERFEGHGFEVERIIEASDSHDKWWEVDMKKKEVK